MKSYGLSNPPPPGGARYTIHPLQGALELPFAAQQQAADDLQFISASVHPGPAAAARPFVGSMHPDHADQTAWAATLASLVPRTPDQVHANEADGSGWDDRDRQASLLIPMQDSDGWGHLQNGCQLFSSPPPAPPRSPIRPYCSWDEPCMDRGGAAQAPSALPLLRELGLLDRMLDIVESADAAFSLPASPSEPVARPTPRRTPVPRREWPESTSSPTTPQQPRPRPPTQGLFSAPADSLPPRKRPCAPAYAQDPGPPGPGERPFTAKNSRLTQIERLANDIYADIHKGVTTFESQIRKAFGNTPSTSKSLRLLMKEKRVKRTGAGGKAEPFCYTIV